MTAQKAPSISASLESMAARNTPRSRCSRAQETRCSNLSASASASLIAVRASEVRSARYKPQPFVPGNSDIKNGFPKLFLHLFSQPRDQLAAAILGDLTINSPFHLTDCLVWIFRINIEAGLTTFSLPPISSEHFAAIYDFLNALL